MRCTPHKPHKSQCGAANWTALGEESNGMCDKTLMRFTGDFIDSAHQGIKYFNVLHFLGYYFDD